MILLKRPIISILLFYIVVIICLDYNGFFLAKNKSALINYIGNDNISITGKVLDEPIIKDKYQQFVLEVNSINEINIKEKTLVSISKAYNINYGDIVCLTGKFLDIQEPIFPNLFNYKTYLQRDCIYTKFYTYEFEHISNNSNKVKLLALKVRNDVVYKIDKYFSAPYTSILKSMIVGDKQSLDQNIKNDFINSGLIHILVISGLHVGFWVAIFLFIFKLLNLPTKLIYLLTIPTIFFYAIVTGANPPAVRATIMASCILISLSLNREGLIYNSIALAALIILIYNPQCLFTASMQLSFVATIGIIYFYPKIVTALPKTKNKIIKFFIEFISVTLSAQIALIPILIFYFGKFSVISFIANILIVPFVGILVAISFIFYVFSFISNYIAMFIAFGLSFVLKYLMLFIHYCANLEFSIIETKIPTLLEIVLYYVITILMFNYIKSKKQFFVVLVLVISFIVVDLPQKEFYKVYSNEKNVTTHIRQNYKDTIIIEQNKKDKFYYSNLQQYLLFSGIKNIDVVYSDDESIREQLSKININEIKKTE